VEKIEVFIKDEVINYLDRLVFSLYEKDYFSYLETAENYVANIYDFIEQNIAYFPHKNTPKKLKNFGNLYIFYKPNTRTTWYIFFDKKDSRYLIKYITNNHTFDSSILNNDI